MAQCSGKHITAMQLFYELKQMFPHLPDRIVSYCIQQARGDKERCCWMLEGGATREAPRRVQLEVARWTPPSPDPEPPRRTRITHMPLHISSDQLLINRQLERKRNLEAELNQEKKRLEEMQRREEELRSELTARLAAATISIKARTISDEISLLRSECLKLWNELDSEEDDFSCSNIDGLEVMDELRWCCHICTFQNHPLLNQCEYCSMPRILSLESGDTQNIHIHVTHHNFPSCNFVHSWTI